MKTYGKWGTGPHINLGIRWWWVVRIAIWPLYPRENLRYLLETKLDGPQSRSGRGGEEKKSLPLAGMEPQSSSP
jgi:hypothetical protein